MYQGYYINLERDRLKRNVIEQNLMDIGLSDRYIRFEAVDGAGIAEKYDSTLLAGELGCWLSHISILHNQINGGKHLHIIEDDALLHSGIAKVFSAFIAQTPDWDVLFTDFFVPKDLYVFKSLHEMLLEYKRTGEIKIFRLDSIPFTCATSYFVNKDSIRKLYKLICNCDQENVPFDLKLRKAANNDELVAYGMIPFFSTISETSQNSSIRLYDISRRAFDLYRRSFYIDAEQDDLSEMMDMCSSHFGPADKHIEMYLKLMRIVCDRNYETF